MLKVAILDDYQNVSQQFVDIEKLSGKYEFKIFSEPFVDEADTLEQLAEFEALLIMRERTPITKNLIDNLTKLKFIITSGLRNKSIDLEATKKRKIIVCGTEMNINPTPELTWSLILGLARNLKAIQLFSLGSFLVLLYFVFQQSQKILSTSFLLGVLTILYSIPFMKSKSLRTLPGVKIFIVALVWAGVTVLFPWFTGEEQLAGEVWLPFVQRILWVVVLTLPFEIRDLAYDLPALGTIPQKLGVRKAKLLGVLFLVAILLLEGFKDTVSMAGILALFFAMALSGAFLLAAKKDQIMYYASFWVEATPLISLAVFLIINDYLSIS